MVISTKVKAFLNNLNRDEINELREWFNSPKIPKGWINIDDYLPQFRTVDFKQGYTVYRCKYLDGSEGCTFVVNPNEWHYYAKQTNITHWFNE